MQFSPSYFFLIILIFGLLNESISIEWNCNNNTNTGNFTLSNDCVISGNDHVIVKDTLEITGVNKDMDKLVTITAAISKRHFYMNNKDYKLILRYVKLAGGNLYQLCGDWTTGGSIKVDMGSVSLYSSILFNNSATNVCHGGCDCDVRAGAVSVGKSNNSPGSAKLYMYDSFILNNSDIRIDNFIFGMSGGTISLFNSEAYIKNTKIYGNKAGMQGGGIYYTCNGEPCPALIIEDSSILNNEAVVQGGGISITAADGVYTQPTTINITRCEIAYNEVTTLNKNGYFPSGGGGGLHVSGKINIFIRESTFRANAVKMREWPNEIFAPAQQTTLSLVNTYFKDSLNVTKNFIELNKSPAKWNDCSVRLCTESPFIGECNPMNKANKKYGVSCTLYGCDRGQYFKNISQSCVGCPAGKFNDQYKYQRNEAESCKNCTIGKFSSDSGKKNSSLKISKLSINFDFFVS